MGRPREEGRLPRPPAHVLVLRRLAVGRRRGTARRSRRPTEDDGARGSGRRARSTRFSSTSTSTTTRRWRRRKLSADEAARDEPNSLSMEEQVRRFRYVVHAEGACSSADRLKQSLGAPAPLLKQASPCTEWFEEMFSPWSTTSPSTARSPTCRRRCSGRARTTPTRSASSARRTARARDVLSVGAIYAYADELVKGYATAYAADAYAPDDGDFTHEFSCDYCAESTSCTLRNRSQAVAVGGCAEARTPSTRACLGRGCFTTRWRESSRSGGGSSPAARRTLHARADLHQRDRRVRGVPAAAVAVRVQSAVVLNDLD